MSHTYNNNSSTSGPQMDYPMLIYLSVIPGRLANPIDLHINRK